LISALSLSERPQLGQNWGLTDIHSRAARALFMDVRVNDSARQILTNHG
jgi:hypothetical protein